MGSFLNRPCRVHHTRAIHIEKFEQYHTPGKLLARIVERAIPVMEVISNPILQTEEAMTDLAKILSSEAVNLNLNSVLEELGQSQHGKLTQDPAFEGVPDVRPVFKPIVSNFHAS